MTTHPEDIHGQLAGKRERPRHPKAQRPRPLPVRPPYLLVWKRWSGSVRWHDDS